MTEQIRKNKIDELTHRGLVMVKKQYVLPIHNSLNVDLFAGGGGASLGSEMALGRHVDIAINHNPVALSIHKVNHPQTTHYISDIFEVDPIEAAGGMPVGFCWASPDCRHFSRAKGGVPVSDSVRGLAWVIVDWAEKVRPTVIAGENVPEMITWGPLDEDGFPDKERAGETFKQWVNALEALGYRFEYRVLTASDYGAPTIRKRLYFIARCDEMPIVWPKPTHCKPDANGRVPAGFKKWKTAAEILDFSIECPSIFDRKKPLADSTNARIAKGVMRYIINSANPFVVEKEKLGEVSDKSSEVAAFLMKNFTGVVGVDLRQPMPTVTAVDHNSLVVAKLTRLDDKALNKQKGKQVWAFLLKWYGTDQNPKMDEPLHTITTKDRFALVEVHGVDYVITDIGLRMLSPRELYRAQGFPETYQIDKDDQGNPITKTNQVKMVGNSVCPQVACAIVSANHPELDQLRLVA